MLCNNNIIMYAALVLVVVALFRVNQSVFVQRGDPHSRSKAASAIKDRAATGGAWPQLVIFPEGMCATHTYLLPYKLGEMRSPRSGY